MVFSDKFVYHSVYSVYYRFNVSLQNNQDTLIWKISSWTFFDSTFNRKPKNCLNPLLVCLALRRSQILNFILLFTFLLYLISAKMSATCLIQELE